jgi:hypothetical protein
VWVPFEEKKGTTLVDHVLLPFVTGMIETSGSKETGRKVICASAQGLKIEQLEKDMWLRGIVR